VTQEEAVVRGVLVDLDDTLYPQSAFLDVAWRAVADRGGERGLDRDALLTALRAEASAGSARGGIIDRALARTGGPAELVPVLLAAFRSTKPDRLEPYPGVREALAVLRELVPLALVSDGEVTGQERKVAALGLAGMFEAVVFSDRWGRERRKPHPHPFEEALRRIGAVPQEAVMIGDRPDKDVAGASRAGLRAIRVSTGEYADQLDHRDTWMRVSDFAAAVEHVLPHLVPADGQRAPGSPAARRAATLA
jgi:putative hydrolase of the HAD superfamily